MRPHSTLFAFVALLFVVMPATRGSADGQQEAPFGLTWGMSTAAIRQLGVELKDVPLKDFGTSYAAAKLPKVLNDVDTVLLSFGYDDKLWRITAISRNYDNDPQGGEVAQRYAELSDILAQKYGKGAQFRSYDPNPLMKGQDFLFQIHEGQAWQYSNFSNSIESVQLAIGATDNSSGYYRIIFTNKQLGSEFKSGKKQHEKDAL